MAFLSAATAVKPGISPLQFRRRICLVRRPGHRLGRRLHYYSSTSAARCSYATDLQTRTDSISAESTDLLLDTVEGALRAGNKPDEAALQEMVVHLADSRGMARLNLVNAFGKIGIVATPYLLQGLTTCPNPVVRRSCGKALAQIGDVSGTQPLINVLLHDVDTVARASAAGALAKIGKEAIPALLEVLADTSVSMSAKGHAAWALSYMRDTQDSLLNVVDHPSDDVRLAVVSALGSVLLGDALPIMNNSAETEDVLPENMENFEHVENALLAALKDKSGTVRAEAVNALASASGKKYIGEVCALLKDENAETRRAAALGLMKIGDTSVLCELRNRVEDAKEDEQVRSVARLALKALERLEEEEEWE